MLSPKHSALEGLSSWAFGGPRRGCFWGRDTLSHLPWTLVLRGSCNSHVRPQGPQASSPGESPFSWNNKTYLLKRVTRPFGSPEGVLISLLSVRKDLLFSTPHSYCFQHGLKVQGPGEVTSCLEASVGAWWEPGKGQGKLRVAVPCGGAGGCACAGGNGGAAELARNVPEAWAGLSTAPGLCPHTPGAARGKPLTSRTQDGAVLLPLHGQGRGGSTRRFLLPPTRNSLFPGSGGGAQKKPFLGQCCVTLVLLTTC